jgi:hypothetical protein
VPFVWVRKEKKRKSKHLSENLKPVTDIQRICYETKVYRDGKEIFVSDELRKRLYGVIAFLPIRKVIDRGYTPKDRKKLIPREAAAVSMLDNRILNDTEFQKEVKDYLSKRRRLEENFAVDELEKDENALYALFYIAHECVKNYIPKEEKVSMLGRADVGQTDLLDGLYGKKSQKH